MTHIRSDTYHYNTLRQTVPHCNALQHTAHSDKPIAEAATHSNTLQHTATHCNTATRPSLKLLMRGGGLGSRPKKMYGERLGDRVEYHLMSPTPRR